MTCSWSAGMRDICVFRPYCYVATFYYIPYLLECKMRVRCKFSYDVLNLTMLSQTRVCIAKRPVRSVLLWDITQD